MVTKICDFQHKIYYNLVRVEDTAQMHARNRGFSGSAKFNGVSQTLLRRPLLPW